MLSGQTAKGMLRSCRGMASSHAPAVRNLGLCKATRQQVETSKGLSNDRELEVPHSAPASSTSPRSRDADSHDSHDGSSSSTSSHATSFEVKDPNSAGGFVRPTQPERAPAKLPTVDSDGPIEHAAAASSSSASSSRSSSADAAVSRSSADGQTNLALSSSSTSGSTSSSDADLDLPGEDGEGSGIAAWLAPLGAVGGLALMVGGGLLFQDQIRGFINFFIDAVDDWGPWGYIAFALVYAGLEILAVPAVPLTLTAGAIFGVIPGTILVSIAATAAATVAFLIARYAVREKVAKFAKRNPNWVAIDRAIGRDGLKFVTLLRLSPLLPLSLSNYLYGLTSVDLGSYVLGSWIGMLPGTYAYISAGHVGKAVLTQGRDGSLGVESWQVAAGLGVSVVAIAFVGRLAKNAIDEIKEEDKAADAAAKADRKAERKAKKDEMRDAM